MMKRVVCIAILLCPLLTLGQTSNQLEAEFNWLRTTLDLPSSTPIELVKKPSLPAKNPLRVHIITGTDQKVRDSFIKAIDKWNRKDGQKYGLLEAVPAVSQADLVLVRIVDRKRGTPDQSGSGTDGSGRELSYYERGHAPMYGSIIARTQDGLKILVRYTGAAPISDDSSDYLVRVKLFDLMKKRPAIEQR